MQRRNATRESTNSSRSNKIKSSTTPKLSVASTLPSPIQPSRSTRSAVFRRQSQLARATSSLVSRRMLSSGSPQPQHPHPRHHHLPHYSWTSPSASEALAVAGGKSVVLPSLPTQRLLLRAARRRRILQRHHQRSRSQPTRCLKGWRRPDGRMPSLTDIRFRGSCPHGSNPPPSRRKFERFSSSAILSVSLHKEAFPGCMKLGRC